MREIDLAAPGRRAGAAAVGHVARRWGSDHAAVSVSRGGVSGSDPVSVANRLEQCRARPGSPGHPEEPASPRRCGNRSCRAFGISQRLSASAFRRHGAAGRAGAALVNDPKILILDEPLGKLDSLTRIKMQAEIASLWQQSGFTTLMVTHDVEEAVFLANRVIVFSDRPARIKADIALDRPYPRHRGDAKLSELRRNMLELLGLDATW